MRYRDVTPVFILVVLSLMLFGCGGGGSSGPTAMPDPDPDPVTPSVDLMDLDVPAGDYTIDAGMTMDVGEGEAEVTLSCSDAADCAFTVDEDGMATATSGVVTAAMSEAAMQAIADREEEERQAKIVADTKAAATKTAAILAESKQAVDAGLGGGGGATGTTPQLTTYDITFERDRDGTTVKITD